MVGLEYRPETPPDFTAESQQDRSVASYERELARFRRAEAQLRKIIALDESLLRQKDEEIRIQELLSRESDHRLLNDLQMVVSLLSLQSRAAENAEAASQLAAAADRITMIGRIHRRLHSFEGTGTVAFKQFLEELCRDFATMLSSGQRGGRDIVVEGTEVEVPATISRPLGFIVNELVTNAVKYGNGRIVVRLEASPGKGYALSVSNDGQALPQGFDPSAGNGLGMRIIRSFVERIGGELRIDRGEGNQGTKFTVLFFLTAYRSMGRSNSLKDLLAMGSASRPRLRPRFGAARRNDED